MLRRLFVCGSVLTALLLGGTSAFAQGKITVKLYYEKKSASKEMTRVLRRFNELKGMYPYATFLPAITDHEAIKHSGSNDMPFIVVEGIARLPKEHPLTDDPNLDNLAKALQDNQPHENKPSEVKQNHPQTPPQPHGPRVPDSKPTGTGGSDAAGSGGKVSGVDMKTLPKTGFDLTASVLSGIGLITAGFVLRRRQ